ncbi:MAG TPA: O-antigen ligase family protein [Steroidobacteraceae bacterium]
MNRVARTASARSLPTQRPARQSIIALIFVWLLIIIMVVPDTLNYGPTAAGMPTEGTALSRFIWLALLGFGAVVTASRSGAALKLLRQVNPYLLLFVALAALSVLWSIDPGVTLRRLLRVVTMVLVAMAFVLMSWQTTRFQNVIRPILTLLLVGSIIFVVVAPDLAIDKSEYAALIGAWHGLATQKNGLGSLATIALILWLHAGLNKEKPLWMAVIGVVVSLICLINSRSSTSIMNSAFSCTLLVMLMRPPVALRRYLPYMIVLFVVALLVYSLAVLNLIPGSSALLSPITMLTGKDQTFSGRTNIWAIVNEHIVQHPFLGTGYGAYWVELPGSPSMVMKARLYYYPTEGHNGYLDIINDLGVVGALCLLGYIIAYLRQGMRLLTIVRPQAVLYLTLMFDQLIANLTESRWLNVLTCEFTIMTIATIAMGKTLLDQYRNAPKRASRPVQRSPLRTPVRPRIS